MDRNEDWLSPKKLLAQRSSNHLNEQPSLWIGPAPTQKNEPPPIDAKFMAAIGEKYDVAKRDEANRQLGKAGEELVIHHEISTLKQAGRHDLAEQVRWTSVDDGDGFGFDISSFEPDGRDRLLEIKTTNGWERTPFHISRNELAVAENRHEVWHLVRVWNFARNPQAFSLRPPIENHAELTATSFLATLL